MIVADINSKNNTESNAVRKVAFEALLSFRISTEEKLRQG